MKKKLLLILILIAIISGGVFAQNRHNPGEMLLGIDLGLGLTPDFFSITEDSLPIGNYAITFDLGLNFDYYVSYWLSINSGLFAHPGVYLLLNKPLTEENLKDTEVTDWAKTPICLTIPIMAHINVPHVEWLYLGAGLNLNIPVASMLDSVIKDIDTKGKFFVGIPIDMGFDFIRAAKRGGTRLFFRITPEIHSGGTPVIIGFMVQPYNFKIVKK